MDGLMLDHFQGFVVLLGCNVSAIDVSVEFLEAETDYMTLLFCVCIMGLDISEGLTGKDVMGHPFWMKAVPKPYSLASVWIMTDWFLLYYARVVLRRVWQIQDFKCRNVASVDAFQSLSASCSQRKLVLFAKPGIKAVNN